MTTSKTTVDPITLAILGNALKAIPEEMGINLYRSAYSTIIRETRDISTALLDRHGRTVAIARYIPMLLNAIQPAFEGCAQYYDISTLRPGECLINNNPFNGGQHVSDIFIFSPVFHDGELVAIAAAAAHHLDLGGGAPSINAKALSVYEEGLVLPAIKVDFSPGWEEREFGRLLRANIRVPEKTIADLNAQLAALRVGELRTQQLVAKYGKELVLSCMDQLMDYSEKFVRKAVEQIPDGDYTAESFMEDDGFDEGPFTVRVAVRVRGSEMEIDFAGTDPQLRGFVNVPLASTISATHSTFVALMGCSEVPANAGAMRPIRIHAPLGTFLNPLPPAPTLGRTSTCYKIFDAISQALAPAIPKRVQATGFNCQTGISFSKKTKTSYQVMTEVLAAGNGALWCDDGADGMIMPLTNGMNTPIEAVEIEYDFVQMANYTLIQDSGGAGTFRGGMGIERSFRILDDGLLFTTHSDRHRHSAPGLFGGLAGTTGRFEIRRGDQVIRLPSKGNSALVKGDVLIGRTGGGAGYGPPAGRSRDHIERDLREGRISPQAAQADYGYEVGRGTK